MCRRSKGQTGSHLGGSPWNAATSQEAQDWGRPSAPPQKSPAAPTSAHGHSRRQGEEFRREAEQPRGGRKEKRSESLGVGPLPGHRAKKLKTEGAPQQATRESRPAAEPLSGKKMSREDAERSREG